MKLVGFLFSLVGNLCLFVAFILSALIMAICTLKCEYNLTLFIVLCVITVGLYIIATIGNKIQDNCKSGLKVKYVLFKLLAWLPNLVSILLGVAGVIVLIFGLCTYFGWLDVSEFTEYSAMFSNLNVTLLGGYLFICSCLNIDIYGSYTRHHCKYCGCNLKGGDYEYEELERTVTVSEHNDRVVSRIRFIFTCPECDGENISYRNMKTDAEKVDNYARGIVGADRS